MSDSKDATRTSKVSLTREALLKSLFGCIRCHSFDWRICMNHKFLVRIQPQKARSYYDSFFFFFFGQLPSGLCRSSGGNCRLAYASKAVVLLRQWSPRMFRLVAMMDETIMGCSESPNLYIW
jgi:hypothetical protein